MIAIAVEGRASGAKVDPAFIAGVIFLRRSCSVNDMAMILGCNRKRVLATLARLVGLGVPVYKDLNAPRYRPLTEAQQEEVTTLHNNGRGLDFYALCRVMRTVHPLALFVFLRNAAHPRGWWMRSCTACGRPFATPGPAVRLCSSERGAHRGVRVGA